MDPAVQAATRCELSNLHPVETTLVSTPLQLPPLPPRRQVIHVEMMQTQCPLRLAAARPGNARPGLRGLLSLASVCVTRVNIIALYEDAVTGQLYVPSTR